ncbi:nicotinate-nucleotide--dimethylbenzimidazole phosphoribosyltransferase [Streptomyces sp. NPDC049879]|uniref:nicotinate-nucleotide--dimethylbenzimidazole phosphoribosyltransferase n=1 Tax=Streptomyces sp. NPDC049879 TaxID=3365598 RepID=UPI00378EEF7B
MTEPGRLPDGEAQEQAGGVPGQVEQQPVMPPAPFSFPAHADEAVGAVVGDGDPDEEDEDLLMPGAIGAWGDTVAPRPVTQAVPHPAAARTTATPTGPEYLDVAAAEAAAQQAPAPWQQPAAEESVPRPEPVVQPAPAPAPAPAPVAVAPETPAPAVPAQEVPAAEAVAPAIPEAPAATSPDPLPAPPAAETAVPASPAPVAPETPAEVPAPAPAQEPVAPEPAAVAPVDEEQHAHDAVAHQAVTPEDGTAPETAQPEAPAVPQPIVLPAPPAPEEAAPAVPVQEHPAQAPHAQEQPVQVLPAAEQPVPELPVQEQPVPDQAPPLQPISEEPRQALPAEPAPEEAAPDQAAPEQPVLEQPVPEQAVPEQEAPAPAEDEPAPAADPTAQTIQLPGPRAPEPPAAFPPAPGYSQPERDAVHRLMRERRDIPHGFRSDPIPNDVLLRVLEAAHTAPSAGVAQPWDFVIIRSPETRQAVHALAGQQRDAYAKSLPKARAKQFKELSVDAILDTPVNIVVTADPTRGGRHTLGRGVQPQLAPHSSALAVENLWLAARAEGLGVGWVGFFDERELVRALDLPGHLEIVAYLCVGYVDAFPGDDDRTPDTPARRPLSWVVHEESYGRRALPGAEPHDLLSETLAEIRPLDAQALGEAWERQKRMTKPAGALGALEIISAQLCGLSRSCPPPVPEPAAVAVFAGDHGVHAQGVTAWPQEVTTQMVANFLSGGAVCNAFASQVGAEVCVVDVGVRGELAAGAGLMPRRVRAGTADFTTAPAMTREEALRAVEVGIETARDLVAAGNKALLTGEMGVANTTVSAALVAAFTGADPAEVTGRGTGIDDETHARKVDVVRRALQLHQPDPGDPIGTLAAVGGLEHAALTGFILGGASLRVPVLLDGVTAGAAALAARVISPEAVSVCIAGHRSAEPGHLAALTALGLRPLVDLDLRLGEGTGALLALPVVQSAARAMREVATFDSAGVTDKN